MFKLPKKNEIAKNITELVDRTAILFGAMLMILGLLVLSAKAPEIHGQLLRSKVGSKVYTIRDSDYSGGGTGFAVQAPSGITYILTNDHVCEVSSDKQTVLVSTDDGLNIRRRIIARSDYSDLCLIESVPTSKGLQLASTPSIGQIIASVGHPSLLPITLSRGEIITQDDASVIKGPIAYFDPNAGHFVQIPKEKGGVLESECERPKEQKIVELISNGFFDIKLMFCVQTTKKAYYTNMLIQPGSSGSPVVNFWGNVVGVVFAGDRAMWAIVVSLDDVKEFLKYY